MKFFTVNDENWNASAVKIQFLLRTINESKFSIAPLEQFPSRRIFPENNWRVVFPRRMIEICPRGAQIKSLEIYRVKENKRGAE